MVHLNVWLTINHMIDDAIKGNKEIKKKKIIIIIIIIEKKHIKVKKKKKEETDWRERGRAKEIFIYFIFFSLLLF